MENLLHTRSTMAKLHSLSVCGIRNFDCKIDTDQTIKFSSPLNLILGQNGCGKTTIIEALRFACTGQLPEGTRSGQSFVHDPKINGQYTAKGQVRLKLMDAKGDDWTISKSVQVDQTSTGLRFKRPDNSIKHKDKAVSGKCLDIDSQCLEVLRVSAPILNNVIFCHQESSCWPLDEAKKLKDKFDEIFEVTAYDKLIKNFRKSQKDKKSQLDLLKKEAEGRKQIKDDVDRLFKRMREDDERLGKLISEIEERQGMLLPINEEINSLLELEGRFTNLQKDLAVEIQKEQSISQQEFLILQNIVEEFGGTDEELEDEIYNFLEREKKLKARGEELESRKSKLEQEEKKISVEIPKLNVQIGRYNQEKEHYNEYKKELDTLLRKAVRDYSIDCSYDLNDRKNVEDCLKKLQAAVVGAQKSISNLQAEYESRDNKKQMEIDRINRNLTGTQQSVNIKENTVKELEEKIRELQLKLNDVEYSDEKLKKIRTDIQRLDKELLDLKKSTNESELNETIIKTQKDMDRMEEERETLEKEYKILQKNDVILAEIDSLKSNEQNCRSNVMKLKSKHHDSLKVLFNDKIPEMNLKSTVEAIHTKLRDNIENLTQNIKSNERNLDKYQYELTSEEKKLEAYKTEETNIKSDISELCQNKPFEEVLIQSERTLEKLQKDKGQLSAGKILYEKFIASFESPKPCCPICSTNFTDKKKAAEEIVKKVKDKIQGIPNELAQLQEKLESQQKSHEQLLQLKPKNQTLIELSTKIPECTRRITELNEHIGKLTNDINHLKSELLEHTRKADICLKLLSDAGVIDDNTTNISRNANRIADIAIELVSLPSNRTKREIDVKLNDFKEEQRRLQQTCESLKRKLDHFKVACNENTENRNNLFQRQLQLQDAMQSRPQLEEQLGELRREKDRVEAEVLELRSGLGPLEVELREARSSKETERVENRRRLEGERKRLGEMVEVVNRVGRVKDTVEGIGIEELEVNLEKDIKALEGLKETCVNLEKAKDKVISAISEVKVELSRQADFYKSLQSNVQLRKKREEKARVTTQIKKLKEKLGDYNVQTIEQQKLKLANRRNELNTEINVRKGKQTELQTKITEMKTELDRPEKRESNSRFKQKIHEVKILEAMMKDIDRYILVLEDSVIQFHKLRMIEINKTIRDLWCSIYRGNDIDYIEIRTEASNSNSATRRSHNYRVVQVKNGIALDMRGRCSAGQKVLACLVIRMALAESFAGNCGILALDEPTTNLDRENVTSLSMTLAALVNEKRAEKNFQLLVITHDEEFLEELKQVQVQVPHYWKIDRKHDGCSTIKKVHI